MLRYAAGEVAAFSELYQRHKDHLYRFVMGSVGDAGTAEEVAQDTWEAVLGAATRYTDSAAFTTWLFTIARRKLVDHYRRSERSGAAQADAAVEELVAAVHEGPERQLQSQQLLLLIAQLPPDQGQALLLKEEGFSMKQIADIVEVGEETVKSRIRYARSSLRSSLGVAYEH